MENTDIQRLRRLLKRVNHRQRTQAVYEWRVQVHRPVEQILELIQNRNNPHYKPAPPEPYTVTANFTSLEEARSYALLARVRGISCTIINNWTGEDYAE